LHDLIEDIAVLIDGAPGMPARTCHNMRSRAPRLTILPFTRARRSGGLAAESGVRGNQ
jgi:hypothetical protein